jgi:hypothetical protein
LAIGTILAAFLCFGTCANARADSGGEQIGLPVDVSQIVQAALADVPIPAEVTAITEEFAAAPAVPVVAPESQPQPVATPAAPPPPQPVAPQPPMQGRYHAVQEQYRAVAPPVAPPPPPARPTTQPPPAPSTGTPVPAAPQPVRPQSQGVDSEPSRADGCEDGAGPLLDLAGACKAVGGISVNSILTFVARYQSTRQQYQLSILAGTTPEPVQISMPDLEIPPVPVAVEIELPQSVVELPEAAMQPVVGLLSPQPARHALPPAARELGLQRDPLVRRVTTARAHGTRASPQAAEIWHPPPPSVVRSEREPATRTAEAAQAPRREIEAQRPAPPAPLTSLATPSGAAPSGAAASPGGSTSAGGAVLAATVLAFFLALVDLMRRLRLEPAQPRSERIDSFPERPG